MEDEPELTDALSSTNGIGATFAAERIFRRGVMVSTLRHGGGNVTVGFYSPSRHLGVPFGFFEDEAPATAVNAARTCRSWCSHGCARYDEASATAVNAARTGLGDVRSFFRQLWWLACAAVLHFEFPCVGSTSIRLRTMQASASKRRKNRHTSAILQHKPAVLD